MSVNLYTKQGKFKSTHLVKNLTHFVLNFSHNVCKISVTIFCPNCVKVALHVAPWVRSNTSSIFLKPVTNNEIFNKFNMMKNLTVRKVQYR